MLLLVLVADLGGCLSTSATLMQAQGRTDFSLLVSMIPALLLNYCVDGIEGSCYALKRAATLENNPKPLMKACDEGLLRCTWIRIFFKEQVIKVLIAAKKVYQYFWLDEKWFKDSTEKDEHYKHDNCYRKSQWRVLLIQNSHSLLRATIIH